MKRLSYIAIAALLAGAISYAQTINPVPFLSRVSSGDTTPNYLFSKLVAGSGVTLTKNNPGANETITITSTGSVASSTIWGMFTNTATGLTYNNTTGETSLTAGYVIPLTASTSQWAQAYASTTALTPAYIRALLSNTATGLSYDSGTGVTTLTAGYVIPLSASTTEWATAYASTTALTPTYIRNQFSATYPIILSAGVISTAFSTSTANTYTATNTFNGQMNFSNASGTNLSLSGALYVSGKSTLANASTTGFTSSGAGFLATTTVTGSLAVTGAIVPRVIGYASNASTTVSCDTTDVATTTISASTTIVNFTGSCYDGQMIELVLMATTTKGLYWGTNFGSSTDLSLPSSVASGTTMILLQNDAFRAKWWLIGLLKTFNN